jgi:hypothetical protein
MRTFKLINKIRPWSDWSGWSESIASILLSPPHTRTRACKGEGYTEELETKPDRPGPVGPAQQNRALPARRHTQTEPGPKTQTRTIGSARSLTHAACQLAWKQTTIFRTQWFLLGEFVCGGQWRDRSSFCGARNA